MGKVVQGMEAATRSMDLERISAVMDKFEQHFTDLDVQTGYMEDAMQDSTAVSTPQDQVDLLMQRVSHIQPFNLSPPVARLRSD